MFREIRYMIYERLPRYTTHTSLSTDDTTSEATTPTPGLTLISHATSTSILATCRQVHQEALPFVKKSIKDWIEKSSVKMVTCERGGFFTVLRIVLGVLEKTLLAKEAKEEAVHNVRSAFINQCEYARRHWTWWRSDMKVIEWSTDHIVSFIEKATRSLVCQKANLVPDAAQHIPGIDVVVHGIGENRWNMYCLKSIIAETGFKWRKSACIK
jgi:hypothetical protein